MPVHILCGGDRGKMNGKTPSNLKQAFTVFFFVVNVFLLVAVLSPKDHFSLSRVVESLDQQVTAAPSLDPLSSPEMQLEWRIVDRYRQGEWEVEKYQEFEVYLDSENQIVKEVPTSHFNYLKYWRY